MMPPAQDPEDRAGNKKKVIVVGDGACGKICLLRRFTQNKFFEEFVPTIFETMTSNLEVDGNMVGLSLWVIAGQEEFNRLRGLSYPNTDCIIICFSVDNPNSLDNVRNVWVPEVKHFCPQTPIVLVGNKTDLRTNQNVLFKLQKNLQKPVKASEARHVAEKIGSFGYYECSAKIGEGVAEVFQAACRAMLLTKPRSPVSNRCRVL